MIQEVTGYLRNLIPRGMEFAGSVLVALLILVIGMKVVKKLLAILKKSMLKKEMDAGVVTFLISAGKIVLNALVIIMAAQVLGFATSSVVAIIGSAGLALGLALQGSLANFAGGVLILVMKPFEAGDYIIVGELEGKVQKIDVVYTTLTTADNRDIILPNGKLADSNIINVTREDKRRIDIPVSIEYTENIKKVRDVLQGVVDRQEAKLDDMPVNIVVSSLDESAVTMTVFLWVSPDDYMVAKWKMLEEIKEEFEKNNIVIPFNQMDVNLNVVANSNALCYDNSKRN